MMQTIIHDLNNGRAIISLKQLTGRFVASMTIIHMRNGSVTIAYTHLMNDADMQMLADTGVKMPTWYKQAVQSFDNVSDDLDVIFDMSKSDSEVEQALERTVR